MESFDFHAKGSLKVLASYILGRTAVTLIIAVLSMEISADWQQIDLFPCCSRDLPVQETRTGDDLFQVLFKCRIGNAFYPHNRGFCIQVW